MKLFLLLLGSFFCLRQECRASATLLKIEEGIKNGVKTIYIQPVTTFERSTLMLDGTVDGSKARLAHPAADLWTYVVTESLGVTHTLSLRISLGNAQKVGQVEGSLAALNGRIAEIEAALRAATDPEEIAALTRELEQKRRLKGRLEADRENLKNFIGVQNHFFKANQ